MAQHVILETADATAHCPLGGATALGPGPSRGGPSRLPAAVQPWLRRAVQPRSQSPISRLADSRWKDVFELTEWFRPGTIKKDANFDPNKM